jgi:hypothetical protein
VVIHNPPSPREEIINTVVHFFALEVSLIGVSLMFTDGFTDASADSGSDASFTGLPKIAA